MYDSGFSAKSNQIYLYTTRAHITQLFEEPIKTFWFFISSGPFHALRATLMFYSLLFTITAVLASMLCQITSYPSLTRSSAWQASGIPSFEIIEQASINLLIPDTKVSNLCALDFGIRYLPASMYFSLLSRSEIRRTTSAGTRYFCATSLIEITALSLLLLSNSIFKSGSFTFLSMISLSIDLK